MVCLPNHIGIIGSEEEFITEHYWGYTKLPNNRTSEYGVEHPKWEVYPTLEYSIEVDFGLIYGGGFACLNTQKPKSVIFAEGSNIRVKSGFNYLAFKFNSNQCQMLKIKA